MNWQQMPTGNGPGVWNVFNKKNIASCIYGKKEKFIATLRNNTLHSITYFPPPVLQYSCLQCAAHYRSRLNPHSTVQYADEYPVMIPHR